MLLDYTLYLVTDRGILSGRDLLEAVESAIRGGVTLVQLREKDISSLEFYNIALKMKQLLRKYSVPLIINDRLDIAIAIDADGLHIGQDDLPISVARKLLGKDKLLGYSVYNVEHAIYGQKNGANYLGAGPIFPTGSKLDAVQPIGVEELRRIKEAVSIPVVAIGGIGASNIHEIKNSMADGISVISAILGCQDIKKASYDLAENWRSF
jgi:thiamine-phosphate pyrophosphorylase